MLVNDNFEAKLEKVLTKNCAYLLRTKNNKFKIAVIESFQKSILES